MAKAPQLQTSTDVNDRSLCCAMGDNDVTAVGPRRHQLSRHRNSWPTNGECLPSQRPIRQSNLGAVREKKSSAALKKSNDDRTTESTRRADEYSPDHDRNTTDVWNEVDVGFDAAERTSALPSKPRRPSPPSQRRIVADLSSSSPSVVVPDSEGLFPRGAAGVSDSGWTYAVARGWYRRWEDYVGRRTSGGSAAKRRTAGEAPGPIEMDVADDERNIYVVEEVWRRLAGWYGVAASHQLDRRHAVLNDDKLFDVCLLSPFSGIVEHRSKRFSRHELVGYVELQLRRIFDVDGSDAAVDDITARNTSIGIRHRRHRRRCRSRLWITDNSSIPRFRQLLARTSTIAECGVQRGDDETYTFAIELADRGDDTWPTGEPGDPVGELIQFAPHDCDCGGGGELGDPNDIDAPNDDTVGRIDAEIEDGLVELSRKTTERVRRAAERFAADTRRALDDATADADDRRRLADQRSSELDRRAASLAVEESAESEREARLAAVDEWLATETSSLDDDEIKLRRDEDDTASKCDRFDGGSETRVRLDVGGQIFTTSVQTLRRYPDSLLGVAFGGRYPLHRDPIDGSYFVDRDARHFRHVLNFMRDGRLDGEVSAAVAADRSVLRELICEAKYFRLTSLVERLIELWKTMPQQQQQQQQSTDAATPSVRRDTIW